MLILMTVVMFSHSVVSNSLGSRGLQHPRLPCHSPSPRAYSNSLPLRWLMPSNHLILCHALLLPSVFHSIRIFSNESALRFRWPEYWSFSLSPSNEYSGLICFRIHWFEPLAVQGTLKSPPTPQLKSINSLALSLLYGPILTSIRDCWKRF